MDRSWMKQSRASDVYDEGVNKFLDFAFNNASFEEKISCPCKKCRLLLPVVREVAYDHLIVFGFLEDYTTWIFHGEVKSSNNPSNESENCTNSNMDIDMDTLLHEAFGIHSPEHNVESNTSAESEDQPNVEAEEFYNFVKDAKKELYPGCKSYTKLSFIVRLFQIKCLGGWSNNSFSMLLDLLKAVLPEGETLPKSFYEMKKIIKKLGLGYEKIHACPNDCILYRKEYQNEKECPKCHASRYLVQENSSSSNSSQIACSKVPAKVLRYFPLIPRLQRLFMCSDTAPLMRWHQEKRTKDGSMRHPADSPAWMTFDYKNQNFSAEPRNVRLGLASDGMNPFRTMSTTYSIWPVILMVYNLPPWMCMKPDNLILSMIIPGPGSPGNNIDIYLQPLVDELKLLYEPGVLTYDISSKTNFQMCAALMWTISDLPALAYISGWSTRGKYGCICCHTETCSKWLKHGRKFCYMDHRRFLDKKHPFRDDEESFDGKKEKRSAPIPLDGNTILKMLEGFEIEFGKTSKNPKLPYNWKKKSIFFELPYWKDNLVRHNLDVMHIEKNVCESIIGTLLNLEGKTKDGLNARLDLELMGLKPELHPRQDPNNKIVLPPACFSLKKEEKTTICKFLKNIKVPDGYAANISRCVHVKDKKIFGLKSHDCHILMQQLLPLAVRGILGTNVYSCLVDLSNFFREIYSKVKRPQDFLRLEREISITLCKLEKIFPPAFFDIVVHLLVHLPREARLAGPVQYRQMYPVERYLLRLKSYPDASSKVLSRNDSYAQVMGQDKNGRVGMCGPGVCPSIVFNDTFTRGANENMLIKTLQHENHQLRSELHQFKSRAIDEPRHESFVNDSTQATEDLTPILQVARRNDWELSMHGDLDINSQIGDIVCLKSIIKPTETIAIGVLYSIDPSSEVGEKELGPDHWEIYVQVAVKPNERLVRACRQYKTIGEAVGDYIAWPKCFVISKEIDSRLYG